MKTNFTSAKDSGKSQPLHSKSDGIELWLLIMLMKLLMSFLVHLLLNIKEDHRRSFIDSSDWRENKRAVVDPKSKYDKCFQYTLAAALSQQNIKNCPEARSNILLFINNWEKVSLPSHVKDWKKFKLNKKSVSLNVLFADNDKEEIKQSYISKHELNCKNKVILLMITDGVKWHLAVKSLFALLCGIKSE